MTFVPFCRLLVLIRRPTVDILKILEQQQANKEELKKENKKKGKRGRYVHLEV